MLACSSMALQSVADCVFSKNHCVSRLSCVEGAAHNTATTKNRSREVTERISELLRFGWFSVVVVDTNFSTHFFRDYTHHQEYSRFRG